MLEVNLILTDIGKKSLAGSLIGHDDAEPPNYFSCFSVRWFEVGEGGVSGGNVLAPDPTRINLVTPISASFQEVKQARINSYNCPIWICELGPGIAGNLSEIGLWAKIIKSIDNGVPVYDEMAEPFLFAYGTYNSRNKESSGTEVFEATVQF